MKKIGFTLSILAIAISVSGQSHVDALRYSQQQIGGTARYIGMGGAFGALGGDFSTLSQNPAGLGVYRGSELTFSPEFYTENVTARYIGKVVSETKFTMNMNNFGYVSSHKNKGALKFVNFGIGYNKIANFNRNYIINGNNQNTSYGDYMAQQAYNDLLFPGSVSSDFGYFTYDLFYKAGIFDYDDVADTFYLSNQYFSNENGDFLYPEQYVSYVEKGKINEWLFSFGMNFGEFLYFGTSFGIQPVLFEQERNFIEYDANDRGYQYFNNYENLKVNGTGYTAKFGAILKPLPILRIGAAFHLPVSYNLEEEFRSSVTADNYTAIPTYYDKFTSEYRLISPSKAILSAATVLGKFLIISGDLEFVDYSTMRMKDKSGNYGYEDVNDNIRTIYTNALNLKLGSEVKLGSYYLRGGFAYLDSPFAEGEENVDAFTLCYSGGFGFRNDKFFFDMSYQYGNSDDRMYLYVVDIADLYDAPVANLDHKTHRVTTTFGFRF